MSSPCPSTATSEDADLVEIRRSFLSRQYSVPYHEKIMDEILYLLGVTGGRGEYYSDKVEECGLHFRWEMPGLDKEDVMVYVEQKQTLVVKTHPRVVVKNKFFTEVELCDSLFQTSAITAEMNDWLHSAVKWSAFT